MANKNNTLSEKSKIKLENAAEIKIAVIISEWNLDITDSLRKAAVDTLIENGISKENVFEFWVPGAFELPLGTKIANDQQNPDALICLGCVIKGETDHDKYISQSVAGGLQSLNLAFSKPVVFGLLTPNTKEQAEERAGGSYGNKGVEAAYTALRMLELKRIQTKKKIGFQ